MTEPIIIERADLTIIVDQAIDRTLKELGIKRKLIKPWMSQNQAFRLVGRRRLERAMERGDVEWSKPDMDKRYGRVYVSRKDVEKLLNKMI